MEKAVDIALASVLPDKEVVRLLGINASTLAIWKGKRTRMIGPQQPQEAMAFEVEEEQEADISDNEPFDTSPPRGTEESSPSLPGAPSQHEDANQALNDVVKLIPEEVNQLRKENRRLKNERDVLQ
ncbi:hypothetical protein [Endozoicomonas lisbonensis]